MTRTTTNRPRMAATYAPGTVRARRWHGEGDVRGYAWHAPGLIALVMVGWLEARGSRNGMACRRAAPPDFRAAPRAEFAVTAMQRQFLTPRACGAARFASIQGKALRPIPAALRLAPLEHRRTGSRRIGRASAPPRWTERWLIRQLSARSSRSPQMKADVQREGEQRLAATCPNPPTCYAASATPSRTRVLLEE